MEKLRYLNTKDSRFREEWDALVESAFELTQYQYALALILLNDRGIDSEQRTQLQNCTKIFLDLKESFIHSLNLLGIEIGDFDADAVMELARPKT